MHSFKPSFSGGEARATGFTGLARCTASAPGPPEPQGAPTPPDPDLLSLRASTVAARRPPELEQGQPEAKPPPSWLRLGGVWESSA